MTLRTSIALSVFNRPDSTAEVVAAIRAAQPHQLFVFGDGARTEAEAALCAQSREVVEAVDWECPVHYDIATENQGARLRYSSGVDWVFEHVEDAIVLDDDCVPDPSFFSFCDEMLERYRHDERVVMVSGSNYLDQWQTDRQSYHFSRYGSVWGWATWKRAWASYDVTMAAWANDDTKARMREFIDNDEIYELQARRFDGLLADHGNRHSWDLPWNFARLNDQGLTIVPATNLVANLGNRDGRGLPPEHPLSNLPVRPLSTPYLEPPQVAPDSEYDELHVRRIFDWWNVQAQQQNQMNLDSRRLRRRISRRLGRVPGLVTGRKS